MLKTKEEIESWLIENKIDGYTINNDLTVSVNKNVSLKKRNLTEIPVQFKSVKGYFDVSHNKLTSLKGSPETVEVDFACNANKLINLIGGPRKIGNRYHAQNNKLESLEGSPEECYYFCCQTNPKLKSLVGAPKKVKGVLTCSGDIDFNIPVDIDYKVEHKIEGDIDFKFVKVKNLYEKLKDIKNNNESVKKVKI